MPESKNGRSKETKGRYLVAVKHEGKTEIFSFSSAKDRQGFLADLKRRWPRVEWATSEAPEE